jgi:hypothetical protein
MLSIVLFQTTLRRTSHPVYSEIGFERFDFFEDFLVVANPQKSKIDEELVEKVQYERPHHPKGNAGKDRQASDGSTELAYQAGISVESVLRYVPCIAK